MRTSFIILFICCLFSCGVLKNATLSKNKDQSSVTKMLNRHEETLEKKFTLNTRTFWRNDSSETISMIEILPTSAIRIVTKRKIENSEGGNFNERQEVISNNKSLSVSTNKTKQSVTQKNKSSKPSIFFALAMILLIGIIVSVARYIRPQKQP